MGVGTMQGVSEIPQLGGGGNVILRRGQALVLAYFSSDCWGRGVVYSVGYHIRIVISIPVEFLYSGPPQARDTLLTLGLTWDPYRWPGTGAFGSTKVVPRG